MRLKSRHRILIQPNSDAIVGKRILDLASHDGRWSMAALDCGALHVTGVEVREHLIAAANEAMEEYHVPKDRYTFIKGDLPSVMEAFQPGQFDTIFCFGFFYHTVQHFELLSRVASLEVDQLLVDTHTVDDADPVVRLGLEDFRAEWAAMRQKGETGRATLVGMPSRRALTLFLACFGYGRLEYFDPGNNHIEDTDLRLMYATGRRATLRAERDTSGATA